MAALVVAFWLSVLLLNLSHSGLGTPIAGVSAHGNHLSKRAYYDLYCPAVLPNPPPAPLIHSISMRVEEDYVTDRPILVYDGDDGITNYLYTPEVLCAHAGCRCENSGRQMICSVGGTRWYHSAIHAFFVDMCASRCRCEPDYVEPPELDSASESNTGTTWSTASDTDSESDINEHFAQEVAILRKHYVKGRLEPDGHGDRQIVAQDTLSIR
ncbi:MAG: hypothetical protein Q9218_006286 [Villophora microphyllina]